MDYKIKSISNAVSHLTTNSFTIFFFFSLFLPFNAGVNPASRSSYRKITIIVTLLAVFLQRLRRIRNTSRHRHPLLHGIRFVVYARLSRQTGHTDRFANADFRHEERRPGQFPDVARDRGELQHTRGMRVLRYELDARQSNEQDVRVFLRGVPIPELSTARHGEHEDRRLVRPHFRRMKGSLKDDALLRSGLPFDFSSVRVGEAEGAQVAQPKCGSAPAISRHHVRSGKGVPATAHRGGRAAVLWLGKRSDESRGSHRGATQSVAARCDHREHYAMRYRKRLQCVSCWKNAP